MAKQRPPAASGEGKTGLVIAVIFLVLTNIITGVMWYVVQSDQEKFVKEKQDALKREKSVSDDRENWQVRALVCRSALGILQGEESKELAALAERKDRAAAYSEEYRRIENSNLKDVFAKNNVKWDATPHQLMRTPKEGGPIPSNVGEVIAQVQLDLEAQVKRAEDGVKELENAKRDFATNLAEEKRKLAEADKKNQDLDAELKKVRNTKSDEYNRTVASLDKSNTEATQDKRKLAEEIEGKNADIKKRDEKVQQLEDKARRLEARLPRPDILDTDRPKGKIERVDLASGTVYIDLGSADFLRPGTTFSVLPSNALGKGANSVISRKAGVEVIRVLGAHSALARFTEVPTLRNPVLSGDLLFNPSWNRGMKTHIAISGLVDLDGDGLDDTEQFKSLLERQGIVVDSYIDLKSLKIEGQMTLNTDFLIIGETVVFGQTGVGGGDFREQRKLDITARMADMSNKAKELGVQPVPIRRYLNLIGFKMPSGNTPADYNAAGSRVSVKPAAEEPKPNDGM